MSRTIRRVLITGAAGRIGRDMRARLGGDYTLRLSDIVEMTPARPNEEVIRCDLADGAAVAALCEGVDAIVHLGGIVNEQAWPDLLPPNYIGAVNLWEGARMAGVDRVLFASSNHATGFYRRGERLDHTSLHRADSRYGLSKAFGEDLAQFYAHKFGVRGYMMRIGSYLPEPNNERCLSTWLSPDDGERLVRAGLQADYVFEVVYGISRNSRAWYDNANAYRLGYNPKDNAEHFADRLVGVVLDDPVAEEFQGSIYVSAEFVGSPSRVPKAGTD